MNFSSQKQPRGYLERSTGTIELKRFAVLVVLIGLIAMPTGRASGAIPPQAFNRRANPGIKRIGFLEVLQPSKKKVINSTGAASAVGGLIGAAIALGETGDMLSKTDEFTREMAKQNLDVGGPLTQTIEAALKKQGYDVLLLPDQRPLVPKSQCRDLHGQQRLVLLRAPGDPLAGMATLTAARKRAAFDDLPASRLREHVAKLGVEASGPQSMRLLEAIRADIVAFEKGTEGLLGEIVGGGTW